jgi:hypothetical protein
VLAVDGGRPTWRLQSARLPRVTTEHRRDQCPVKAESEY